ncbi:MAG: hypothetical protein HQK54_08105 [Oligoflexales bacterium]|nr:hypothetical protein [Oligoflexales bacterium]
MSGKPSALDDRDYFYGYLSDYVDENLSAPDSSKYVEYMKKENLSEIPAKFGKARGNLQMIVQEYGIDELQLRKLIALVEDDASRVKHENQNIVTVGKSEFLGNLFRRICIFGGFFAIVFFSVYYLTPKRKASFDILNSLKWEAISMEEDPDWRLDLPSNDLKEVQEYLSNYRELGFEFTPLKNFDPLWEINGASVLDYESTNVIVMQFIQKETKDRLYFFLCEGKLTELPKSELNNRNGLLFQAYGVGNLEIISFQYTENVLGLMMSHRGSFEMADLAQKASVKM